jgi:hypothetical protein
MVTLADLRARSTVPSWQQAVAIVQELFLATVGERGSAARLPDIAHIGLNPDGSVALLPQSSIPENPVRHLAVLLCLMLENVPAPGPLLDLAERNLKDPPEFPVPEEFTRSLRYFERPGRDEDIKELVTRAERAREQKPLENELRHLEERARQLLEAKEIPERHVLERDGTVTIVKREPELGRGPRLPAVSTAEVLGPDDVPPVRAKWDVHGTVRLVIIVAAVGFFAYWITHRDTAQGPTSVEEQVAGAARRAFGDAPRGGPGTSSPSADRAPVPTPPPSPDTPTTGSSGRLTSTSTAPAGRRSSSAPAATGARSGASAAVGQGSPTAPVEPLPAVQGGPIAPLEQDRRGPASERTFSGGDTEVTPPVLLGRGAPAPVAGAPAATYEVMIDASGNVEQVRLIAGDRGMRESMMRAHVKSWKFRPATSRGGAVPYRMQIRVAI